MHKNMLILVLSLLAATTLGATIYKWVDEEGVTHYTETHPLGKKAEKVDTPPPPPKQVTEDAQRKLQNLRERELRKKLSPELLLAIESGDAKRTLFLLQQGADPDTKDTQGRTALMYAGINGQTRIIMRELLGRGANVNVKSADGTTALMATVIFGDPEAIRLLLSSGADVNARDYESRSALAWAQQRLGTASPDRTAFPNMPERNQYGDLTFATKKEFREIIELLKKAGAKD